MPGIRFRRHGQQGHVLGAESAQELFEVGRRQGLDMASGMGAAFVDHQKRAFAAGLNQSPCQSRWCCWRPSGAWEASGRRSRTTPCPSGRKRQKPGSPGSLR